MRKENSLDPDKTNLSRLRIPASKKAIYDKSSYARSPFKIALAEIAQLGERQTEDLKVPGWNVGGS